MKTSLRAIACLAVVIGAVCGAADAAVRVAGVFGDGMVLQGEANVPVWGWAEPGEKITVRLGEHAASVVAASDGKWRAVLPALKAGGPLAMTVAGAKDSLPLTLKDVLVGDVWLCSGQSNMDTNLSREPNAAEEIRTVAYPQIRLFRVPTGASPAPRDDVKAQWVSCSPKTAGSFPSAAYFFARRLHKELGVPIGLLHAAVGDSSILTWMSPQALGSDPALNKHVVATEKLRKDFAPLMAKARPGSVPYALRSQGGFLYNGMVSPLAGYGIRGAIWYQGEKDGWRYQQYPLCFRAMVTDWRRSWGMGDFPFLFVQLSTYKGWGDVQAAPDPTPNEGTWGFIREAQTLCLAVPNTAMAVSLDRQDFNDAHPKNKRAVGERLALAALAKAYGKDIVHSGPMYESMKVEGGKIRLRFSHVGRGLVVDGAKGKNGFAVAGKDRKFVWAEVAVDGDTLVAWSKEVPEPAAVRYAWANFPYFGLSNKDGLPAPTFRTDDWPRPKAK